MLDEALLDDVKSHDEALLRHGVEIWLGSEPTFTNPRSHEPCWLGEALGGEKADHARALLSALSPRLAGPVRLLQVLGRLYPGESAPRWCYGALFARRGAPSGVSACASKMTSGAIAPTPSLSASEAWLTVTPDPGVVEVNMAPAHDLQAFASWSDAVFAAASEAALSPLRFRFNGDIADSGGGGQITLGGPTPARSPFFVWPQLLPGLVRYVNRHPALSYLFAPPFCGSASQGPRVDESVRERFDELPVALDWLAHRGSACTPAELWGMLSPLLVDASGCAHRAELNIEKLWNPGFGERGQLGLVELRALRMPSTPARLVAIAALFRALAARLAVAPYFEPVIDWGRRLHDEISLPWYLERDLQAVLADLDAHGFGLGKRLREELTRNAEPIATLTHPYDGVTLELRAAISFWPLVGDVAVDGTRGMRLVDSSSSRLQLLVSSARELERDQISVDGWRVPLRSVNGSQRRRLGSVLYRSFVPRLGMHPGISAQDPLTIAWVRGGRCLRAMLHAWRPNGGGYDGVPRDHAAARQRRRERVVVSECAPIPARPSRTEGLMLDLRRQHASAELELADSVAEIAEIAE